MSNIMKPPPEYHTPPIPAYTPVPSDNQQPRKSYRWIWMILGTLALLGILGGVFLALAIGFAIETIGGPTMATDQYYTAIKNQDYATAYTYLGSHLKTVYSQEAFTQAAQQRDTVSGKVSSFAFSDVPTGVPSAVTLTVTRMNGTPYTVHLELRQEGGTWKITAFDRI